MSAVEKLLADTLRAESAAEHGWRCGYPDMYPGYCTCYEDTAKILAEVLRGDGLAEQVAEAIEDSESYFGATVQDHARAALAAIFGSSDE